MLKSKTKLFLSMAAVISCMAVVSASQAEEAYKGWIQWHPQTGPNTISTAGTQYYPYQPSPKPACEHGMDAAGNCVGDADGDGVTDGKDKCPGTPAQYAVDAVGCSLDRDGDGVNDAMDRCPDSRKGVKVDARGCELDDDQDGVVNSDDKCPGTSVHVKVDATGCEISKDGDMDGVLNEQDACLDTPKGLPVGKNGCWSVNSIHFNTGSWELDAKALSVLNAAVATMKQHAAIRVEVQGHTDSRADDTFNKKLSLKRAESVIWYMTKQGLARDRFVAAAFGEQKLLNSEKNSDERLVNRRVELHRIP